MTIDGLLDAAKKASNAENDSELAAKLGIKPSAVSNYRKGVSLPNAVVCATLAGLTGEPLVRVIGVVGEARAISREEKAVWRKVAATAMLVLCAVGFAGGAAPAHSSTSDHASNAYYVIKHSQAGCAAGWAPLRPVVPQPCNCSSRIAFNNSIRLSASRGPS